MQRIVLICPIDVDIRHVKDPLKCAAAKINAERMADKAVCSVASNYILCLDRFEITRCIFNIRHDPCFGLRKLNELRLPSDIATV